MSRWDRMRFRLALLLLYLAPVAGCSTASHEDSVASFAHAAIAADRVMNDYARAERRVRIERQLDKALAANASFGASEDCGRAGRRCALLAIEGGHQTPIDAASSVPNGLALSAALVVYAKGLVAFTDDAARTSVAEATGQFDDALKHLADTVDRSAGSHLAGVIRPVTGAVTVLGNLYVEREQLTLLRAALLEGRKIVPAATDALASEVQKMHAILLAAEALALDRAAARIGHGAAAAPAAQRAAERAASLDVLQAQRPDESFRRLGALHEALAATVLDGRADREQVFAAARDFLAQAQRLDAALE